MERIGYISAWLSEQWADLAKRNRLIAGAAVLAFIAWSVLGRPGASTQNPTATEIFIHDDRLDVPASAPNGQSYITVHNGSKDVVRIEYRDLPQGSDPLSPVGPTSTSAEKRIVLPPLDPGEDWDGRVNDLRPGRYAILAVRVGDGGVLTVPAGAVSVFAVERQADPASSPPPVITMTTLVYVRVSPGRIEVNTDTFAGHIDVIESNDTSEAIRVGQIRMSEGADPSTYAGRAVHRSDLSGWGAEIAAGKRWKGSFQDGFFPPGRYVLVAGTVKGDDLVVPTGEFATISLR